MKHLDSPVLPPSDDLGTDLRLYHGMMIDRSAEYCDWVNRKVAFGTCIERAIEMADAMKRPEVWKEGVAEAFWNTFAAREMSGKHGRTENTFAALIAAMRAQGVWP